MKNLYFFSIKFQIFHSVKKKIQYRKMVYLFDVRISNFPYVVSPLTFQFTLNYVTTLFQERDSPFIS